MKKITPDEYDEVVGEWREWQSFPWSKLLYDISLFNISRHLDNHKLNILDVGGGNGFNSIHYAKQGHSVTLLDYSSEMLSDEKRSAEKEGVLEKITFCQADAEEIKSIFVAQEFDFIICHLMIEFVVDPGNVLKNICDLIAPEGLLSILDANRYSQVYRKALQSNNLVEALKEVGTKEYFHPWFSRQTPLFSSAEMIEILHVNDCEVVGDYGIRCLCDYLPNEPKYEAEYFAALEELERKLTDTYPYNLLARFYQIIMQKK
ncbi:MAG: methyltransferase domain-containing protein [Chloroflexi bacterium]|nr:methyltransferase domain-containing protein [Chloroflexota bacterium]MBU1659857.1 methyltransferase domain-containing protein [Chloroflexota bacterium]